MLREHEPITLLSTSRSTRRPIRRRRASARKRRLARSAAMIKEKPDLVGAKKQRAIARLRLDDAAAALDDLNALIGTEIPDVEILPNRAIVHARLHQDQEALADLARYRKTYTPEHSKLFVAAVVAAESGIGLADRIRDLEHALEIERQDADPRYETARAYSLASRAVGRKDQAEGQRMAARAVRLLRKWPSGGPRSGPDGRRPGARPDSRQARVRRDHERVHPERRYAAVWMSTPRFESKVVACIDPAEQRRRSVELADQNYRPVAWSVATTAPVGPLATVSVWRRPVVSDEEKDRLAERQARAAVALLRLGHSEEIWPLLKHSPTRGCAASSSTG